MPYGMYAFYRSVRKSYPKIDFEICFLSDSLGRHFDVPAPVLGENAIPEGLQRHCALLRIEPKQVVHFGRPIPELATAPIPGPTACLTQMLGFGQIGLATSQLPFRLLGSRNINPRPNELDAVRRFFRSTSHSMNIFH